MKIADLTQFYSPVSGGVKRYLHEKIGYIQKFRPSDEHVLIVPGEKTKIESNGRSRIYSIRSPLISRSGRYRALLNLRAVEEILRQERPDIIESGDPYQLGWKAVRTGRALKIPVVGFYHSHFPEAYLRSSARLLGKRAARRVMRLSRNYVRKLYNQFEATLVASERLAGILREWGVRNVVVVNLGVNTSVFRPGADHQNVRRSLGIDRDCKLLLYVGRLAREKNTSRLFKAVEVLEKRYPHRFHLLVIGEGPQRRQLRRLKAGRRNISWIRYCAEPARLAEYYRAADLFVHPGMQETFGLVALEAQACGLAVVGIRGSSLEDVIFHDRSTWAHQNTSQDLAEAISASAEQPSEVGTSASQQVAQLYSWRSVFDQLFCIYREICSNYNEASRQ